MISKLVVDPQEVLPKITSTPPPLRGLLIVGMIVCSHSVLIVIEPCYIFELLCIMRCSVQLSKAIVARARHRVRDSEGRYM